MPLPLGFTGARLDRADRPRTDPEAFAAALADPRATCLMLDGLDPVSGSGGGPMGGALDPADELALLLLGIDAVSYTHLDVYKRQAIGGG